MMMSIREIATICELPKYRNFQEAAYALCYSPSVITKYVANTENELGITLFVRSKKAGELTITKEGEAVINSLRRVIDSYHYTYELAKQLSSGREHSVRIGSQPWFGGNAEQELLARFLAEDLGSEVDIVKADAEDIYTMMKAARLDAAFITVNSEIDADELLQDELEGLKIEKMHVCSDSNMYLGVSEKLMPEAESAPFDAFHSFTFALPGGSKDASERANVEMFHKCAKKCGFDLKSMYLSGDKDAALRLAAREPVAIPTVGVFGSYPGIKFVRIEDWPGSVDVYFVHPEVTRNEKLLKLKDIVGEYVKNQN